MLNTIHPITFIVTSIYPTHLSEPISHICLIVAFINVATCPSKYPISPLLVVSVITIIVVGVTHPSLPKPMTIPQAIHKIAFKVTSIKPIILSIPGRLTINISSLVHITIRKSLYSLTMLQTFLKLSLISITIWPSMHSITFRFTKFPLTFIGITFLASPHAWTMLKTV